MSDSLVQSTEAGGGSANPSIALNNVTAGNLVIFLLFVVNNPIVSSPADNNGALETAVPPSNSIAVYFVQNAAAGAHEFTCSLSKSVSWQAYAAEFAGSADALDLASPVAANAAGTAFTSDPITPSHDGELVISFAGTVNAPAIAWTNGLATGGFNASAPSSSWAWASQGAAAAVTASGTLSFAEATNAVVVAFGSTSGFEASAADDSNAAGSLTVSAQTQPKAYDEWLDKVGHWDYWGSFTGPAAVIDTLPNGGEIHEIFPRGTPTSGKLILNDCLSPASATTANQLFELDFSQITDQTVISVNVQVKTGVVISSVPEGVTLAVSVEIFPGWTPGEFQW